MNILIIQMMVMGAVMVVAVVVKKARWRFRLLTSENRSLLVALLWQSELLLHYLYTLRKRDVDHVKRCLRK